MSKQCTIRPIAVGDIQAVTDIYAYYADNKAVTFEWEAPTMREMQSRMEAIVAKNFPYLVLEDEGKVIGYAYAAPFRGRIGWQWTAEVSIYLAHNKASQGYGYPLLQALIKACEKTNLRMLISTISSKGNIASIRLHQKAGFRIIGTMLDAGYKFDDWHDVVFMQCAIGEGAQTAPKL